MDNKIVTIKKTNTLYGPNANGIIYERDSMLGAIDRFIKMNESNVTCVDNYDVAKFEYINPDTIIGKCIEINDNNVKVELCIDEDDFESRFKNPIALLRMNGESIRDNYVKVNDIIAVDIINSDY